MSVLVDPSRATASRWKKALLWGNSWNFTIVLTNPASCSQLGNFQWKYWGFRCLTELVLCLIDIDIVYGGIILNTGYDWFKNCSFDARYKSRINAAILNQRWPNVLRLIQWQTAEPRIHYWMHANNNTYLGGRGGVCFLLFLAPIFWCWNQQVFFTNYIV